MIALLTTIPLLFAFTQAPTLDPGDDLTTQAPAPAVEQPEYSAAVERLRQADQDANSSDAVASVEALSEAIAALEEFGPLLAGDDTARQQRQDARLNLARAHRLAEQDELAAQVMDEAIREAMGDPVQAIVFGPSLEEFYLQRLELLEQQGRASLVVSCVMACKVYVDEREVGPEPPPLLLGAYRVWIEDSTGKRSALRDRIELSEAGQVYELRFAPIHEAPPPPPPPPPPSRIMPRWAEVALTVVGVGLTTTGAVLLGLGSAGSNNSQVVVGGAIGAVGLVALLPGVITLSVDERRLAGQRGHQAVLSWTTRF